MKYNGIIKNSQKQPIIPWTPKGFFAFLVLVMLVVQIMHVEVNIWVAVESSAVEADGFH